jgi:hypothetical protein
MAVTAAQLAQIRDQLFLIQSQSHTELTMPSDSTDKDGNDDPLVKALDKMISDLLTQSPRKYDELGVAVADFTKDPKAPRIWLHNSENPWRIASAGKVSVLLAAVQLRDDVRLVKEVTNLTDPKAYDQLFANPELWKPKDPSDTDVQLRNSEITHPDSKKDTPANHCPRPSTIFDLTKDPVDFRGSQITDAAAKHAVALKLGWKPGKKPADRRVVEQRWAHQVVGCRRGRVVDSSWFRGQGLRQAYCACCIVHLGDHRRERGNCRSRGLRSGKSGLRICARAAEPDCQHCRKYLFTDLHRYLLKHAEA